MSRYRWASHFAVLLVIFGCGKPLPILEAVDLSVWQGDHNGCGGRRVSMQEAIQEQKDKLLALNEKQVVKLLGKPDQNELYKRNQKFYTYFISPAPSCETAGIETLRLVVRFNAMGLAKEVSIE